MMHRQRPSSAVAILIALGFVGCRQTVRLPPPLPTPTIALSSEAIPAETRVELVIGDLTELVTEDKVEVVVSGLVVNRGSRPTTSVKIRVQGLARDGAVVREAQVTPTMEQIPPDGGSARFSAVFPNDPTVIDYHIEAIGYGRNPLR